MQVHPGTRAVIERWGGPPLQGRVRRIKPAAFTKISALGIEAQRVKVLIEIVDPVQARPNLGDGFRVSVRVVTQSVDDALVVLYPPPGVADQQRVQCARPEAAMMGTPCHLRWSTL